MRRNPLEDGFHDSTDGAEFFRLKLFGSESKAEVSFEIHHQLNHLHGVENSVIEVGAFKLVGLGLTRNGTSGLDKGQHRSGYFLALIRHSRRLGHSSADPLAKGKRAARENARACRMPRF